MRDFMPRLMALILLVSLFTTACDGGSKNTDNIQLNTQGQALSAEGDLDENGNELNTMVPNSVAAASTNSEYFEIGFGNLSPLSCASRTDQGNGAFMLDMSGCDNLTGKILVETDRVGLDRLVMLSFQDDFKQGDDDVDGQLRFLGVTGKSGLFTMRTEDANGQTAPISVTRGPGDVRDIEFKGYLHLDVTKGWQMWGTGTAKRGNVSHDRIIGGTTASAVSGTTAPITALTWEFPRRTCECPISGTAKLGTKLTISSVSLDLDDFQDDANDDFPTLTIPVSVDASGSATVTFNGCGVYSHSFTATADVSVDLTGAKIKSVVDSKCASGDLNAQQCDRLTRAINALGSKTITVKLAQKLLDAVAKKTLDADFNPSRCAIP